MNMNVIMPTHRAPGVDIFIGFGFFLIVFMLLNYHTATRLQAFFAFFLRL